MPECARNETGKPIRRAAGPRAFFCQTVVAGRPLSAYYPASMKLSNRDERLLRSIRDDKLARICGIISGLVCALLAVPFGRWAMTGLDFHARVVQDAFVPMALIWLDTVLLFGGIYLVMASVKGTRLQKLTIRLWERVQELEAAVEKKPE